LKIESLFYKNKVFLKNLTLIVALNFQETLYLKVSFDKVFLKKILKEETDI